MSAPDLLIGLWHILHWHEIYEDGRIHTPFGTALRGFLRYTADGHMMCVITKPTRARFATDHQYQATSAEKAQAYDDVFVYAGRFERADHIVTHYVDYALFPNWQHSTQQRHIVQLDATHLCLEADKRAADSAPHIVQIAWQRAL